MRIDGIENDALDATEYGDEIYHFLFVASKGDRGPSGPPGLTGDIGIGFPGQKVR